RTKIWKNIFLTIMSRRGEKMLKRTSLNYNNIANLKSLLFTNGIQFEILNVETCSPLSPGLAMKAILSLIYKALLREHHKP
ncbi:hypothetical protein VIGAN_02222600, partial [Vigna angularis var. angularis]